MTDACANVFLLLLGIADVWTQGHQVVVAVAIYRAHKAHEAHNTQQALCGDVTTIDTRQQIKVTTHTTQTDMRHATPNVLTCRCIRTSSTTTNDRVLLMTNVDSAISCAAART